MQLCDFLDADSSAYALEFWLRGGDATCTQLASMPVHLQLAVFDARPGKCARTSLASSLHTLPAASREAAVAAACRGGTLAVSASDGDALDALVPALSAATEVQALRALEIVDASPLFAHNMARVLEFVSARCTTLSRLTLGGGGLTRAAVAPVGARPWPALRRIDYDLQGAAAPHALLGWDAGSPAALAAPTQLEHIVVRRAAPAHTSTDLMACVRAAAALTALELYECELSTQWPVAHAVRALTSLKRLAVVGCGLAGVGASEVLAATCSATQLVDIDFSRTPGVCIPLDADVDILLGRGAAEFQALTHLRAAVFGACGLEPRTAIALVRALPAELTSLELGVDDAHCVHGDASSAAESDSDGAESEAEPDEDAMDAVDAVDAVDQPVDAAAQAATRLPARVRLVNKLERFTELRSLVIDGLSVDASLVLPTTAAPLAGVLHAAARLTRLDIASCVLNGSAACALVSDAVAGAAARGALRSVALPDPFALVGSWDDPGALSEALTARSLDFSQSLHTSVATLAAASPAAAAGLHDVIETCHARTPGVAVVGREEVGSTWCEPESLSALATLRSLTALTLSILPTPSRARAPLALDALSALRALRVLSVTAPGSRVVEVPACTSLADLAVYVTTAAVPERARAALLGVTRLVLSARRVAAQQQAADVRGVLAALPSTASAELTTVSAATPGLASLTRLTSLTLQLVQRTGTAGTAAAALAPLTRLAALWVTCPDNVCSCAPGCGCASALLSGIGALSALTSLFLRGFAGASGAAFSDALAVSRGRAGHAALQRLHVWGDEGPWAREDAAAECMAAATRIAAGLVHVCMPGAMRDAPQWVVAALIVMARALGEGGVETLNTMGWSLGHGDAMLVVAGAGQSRSLRDITVSRTGWGDEGIAPVRACARHANVRVVPL